MKNKLLGLITFTAICAFSTAFAGDIYDIRACGNKASGYKDYPVNQEPLYSVDKPMVIGDSMYFKVRFIPRVPGSEWELKYDGVFDPDMAQALFPLQMGIFVGGTNRFDYANCVGTLQTKVGIYTCTDLIFEYKVQAGDFALPISTASVGEDGSAIPTFSAAFSSQSYKGYYINPASYQWRIVDKTDGKTEADWLMYSGSFSPVPVRDLYLHKAGYYVKSVDFDKDDDYKPGDIWRQVHQGSTLTVGADPRLKFEVPPVNALRLYVWSTNEDVVVVAPSSKVNVFPVKMRDPNTGNMTEYSVGEIVIEAGQTTLPTFKIKGVDKTKHGGVAGLVLSAYSQFNYAGSALSDFIDDTLTIPVQCIDELPPTVSVACSSETVWARSDYQNIAAQFTIRTSQALKADVEVVLKPSFIDGEISADKWPEYMRFSMSEAFPSVTPDPTGWPRVTIPAGATEAELSINMFALRSDAHTRGTGHGIAFTPWISEEQKAAAGVKDIEDCAIMVRPEAAEIIIPTEESTLTPQPVCNENYEFTIQLTGTYADQIAATDGYKVYVRYPGKTFAPLDDVFYLDTSDSELEGGVLKKLIKDEDEKWVKTDDLPALWFATAADNQEVEFYVIPPVSGSDGKSDIRKVIANVKDQRAIRAVTTDDTENEYNEGDTVNIKITLSENTSTSPMFAFLKPVDSAYATNSLYQSVKGGKFITCGMNGSDAISGIKIAPGATEITGSFMILDGYSRSNGGLNAGFEVLLAEEQTSTNKLVKGYNSNELDLTIYNVEPKFTRFELNGVKYLDGETALTKYPLGQEQKIKAVIEDVKYDLDNKFKCRWTPYCDDIPLEPQEIEGNPANNPFTYSFGIAGHWRIELEFKDKDMDDWKSTSYSMYVDIVDKPQVSISAPETIDETARREKILVGLGGYYDSIAAESKAMQVMIRVKPPTGDNPGVYKLDSKYVNTDPTLGPVDGSAYIIEIKDTKDHEIAIEELDGTSLSDGKGFTLEAFVINTDINKKTGDRWCDYYLTNSIPSYVFNVAPNNNDADGKTFAPLGDINTPSGRVEVAASRATDRRITWRVNKDVAADLAAGITVRITGGGGEKYNEDGFVNGVKKVTEPTSGTYIPDFSGLTGDQQVMIEIEDKDMGVLSQVWYFSVTRSKTLLTYADGPSGGTTKQLSKKYQGAAGIGKGHIYVKGYSGTPTASDFVLSWNCGKELSMLALAYGYRVGAVDDGKLNNSNDIAINPNGGTYVSGAYYKYDDSEKDSYLYAWLKPTSPDDMTGEVVIEVAPEWSDGTISTAEIPMPTQEAGGEKGGEGYPKVSVEAIFSKEYLASDNMGDINQDGIPDLYVSSPYYDFNVDYTQFRGEGSDMAMLDKLNDDEDFLPVGIGGTGNKPDFLGALPFTAYQEIRGLGDGFNNGPAIALTSIPGAKPDPDFSELELASARSLGYTSAKDALDHGWSPERPTDPFKADTDEDGLPDGYEYWFWYRAHVGYFDGGKLCRLQGERYNPEHPEKGDVITWQEIEKVFDPIVPNAEAKEDIYLVDTDNDGLPDILEFELGTNPIHWDTDGDGLPDYWEVLKTNLDPCKAATDGTHNDGTLNPDHDFMAKADIPGFTIITSVGEDGRAVYYATFISALEIGDAIETKKAGTGWKVMVGDKVYVIQNGDLEEGKVYVKVAGESGDEYYLASDFKLNEAFEQNGAINVTKEPEDEGEVVVNEDGEGEGEEPKPEPEVITVPVRGLGAELVRGTKLAAQPEKIDWYEKSFIGLENELGGRSSITSEITDDFYRRGYSVWQYGKNGPYVMAGNAKIEIGTKVIMLTAYETVRLLHHHVYQWRGFKLDTQSATNLGTLDEHWDMGTGFDPTTAWNVTALGLVNNRWYLPSPSDPFDAYNVNLAYGQQGHSADTAAYSVLDEYLFMNFRQHCGFVNGADLWEDLHASPQVTYANIWAKNTTFPMNQTRTSETTTTTQGEGEAATTTTTTATEIAGYGADTDGDGVPDGWEAYVACGPGSVGNIFNNKLRINPLYNEIANNDEVDRGVDIDPITNMVSLEGDGLTYVAEFSGTDSTGAYSDVPSIVAGRADAKWLNKFWPTDPWSTDTDCDGVTDSAESAFIYKVMVGSGFMQQNDGTNTTTVAIGSFAWPTDNGGICIAGGGMNPCSWDTDQDGLPDAWELQYTGAYIPSTRYCTSQAQYRGYLQLCAINGVTPSSAFVSNLAEADGFFVGGMDGSVPDSYTKFEFGLQDEIDAMRPMNINRDYDYDGLQNWQEYLTCTIRAFRYDDTLSPWTVPQKAEADGSDEMFRTALLTGKPLNPLMDGGSNPNLIFGAFDCYAAYGSKCRRGWDLCYDKYYFFPDGPNHILRRDEISLYGKILNEAGYGDEISQDAGPTEYATCDPRVSDSDGDGMDDYYELFHGLNPLYGGKSGSDLISVQWGGNITAEDNYWQREFKDIARGDTKEKKARDFALFPWMAGDPAADPDGDDIRNVDEAIQANIEATSTWLHTDPTPLWMTDSTYSKSIVNRYYALPNFANQWADAVPTRIDDEIVTPINTMPAHKWMALTYNWAFEENDGYDSDHDGLSDYRESTTKFTSKTDPQDEDDPRRRQAMYFPGEKSALQARVDPIFGGSGELFFLEFTVECWARPERVGGARQTIVERVINHGPSNPGDRRYYRRNFQLGIDEGGHYYAAYDSNGTGIDRVIATSKLVAEKDVWAHLAATYDGTSLVLYVNGQPIATTVSGLHPAISAETPLTGLTYDNYRDMLNWDYDIRSYMRSIASNHAIIYGASAIEPSSSGETAKSAMSLDVSTSSWEMYDCFYNGYIDEIRIWDGARSKDEILDNYKKRFTAVDVAANQKAIYKARLEGARRDFARIGEEALLPPELAYHYTFDGLFAATAPEFIATEPFGFNASIDVGGKAACARPDDYECTWWAMLETRSQVYNNYAYVPWIPNTLAHLPRFDGTTLDSVYWSENYAGSVSAEAINIEKFNFPRTHELYGGNGYIPVVTGLSQRDTRSIIISNFGQMLDDYDDDKASFTEREAGLYSTDLLPLGGAYVRYCESMWDEEGPSTLGETSGKDEDFDNLPDWWEALQPGFIDLTTYDWDTPINARGGRTAGELFRRDVAVGAHETAEGGVLIDDIYKSIADVDHDGMADWWEDIYGVDTHSATDGFADPDGDGLSNYAEYLISEVFYDASLEALKLDPRNPRTDGYTLDYFQKFGDLYVGEVFTDHDQVNDDWEGKYSEVANRYLYDPERDEDGDGWSNYAESRAGTDPSETVTLGFGEYTKNEYPVPVIEAKVVYNGQDVNLGSVVFKAWSEESDPDMTSAPDAIWTFGNAEPAAGGDALSTAGSAESGSSLTEYEKYIGKKPSGVHRYVLSGGSVSEGSVRICFCNPNYSILTVTNGVPVSAIAGDPDDAEWFFSVSDKNGKLVYIGVGGDHSFEEEEEIGTIDYKTGLITINFDAFTGLHYGDLSTIAENSTGTTSGGVGDRYYVYDIDTAYVRLNWSAKLVGLNANGTYYLSDSDVVSADAKSHGHIREGKNTFVCYLKGADGAEASSGDSGEGSGSSSIQPGTPFGVIRGVDVGWQGAKFTIEINETSAISPRIALWSDTNDRDQKIDGVNDIILNDRTIKALNGNTNSASKVDWMMVLSNRVDTTTPPQNDKVRIRVVRYGIDDMFAYMVAGYDQRAVIDKMFDRNARDFLSEADFLGDDIFDLDWENLRTEVVENAAVKRANLAVTNMTYLVVIGDGAKDIIGSQDTNTTIRALASVVTRRFEMTQSRPQAIGVIGGGDVVDRGIVFSARPTFVWAVPDEDPWAKRFGSTYTAFKIQVKDADSGELIYESPVTRAPEQDENGWFRWTAPISVGEQTPQGKVFKNAANYTWCVAMYNAKFTPASGNLWSLPNEGTFSTDVNMQQELNDRGYSSVNVSVKYAGPKAVLDKCADLSDIQGKVRVQAFTTADFSGEAVSETQVTDFDSLTDLTQFDSNAKLIGLPADGVYYVRAYIDMNGNFKKDDFESWGYAKKSATLSTENSEKQYLIVYIEDADTNGNWHPDAWEYADRCRWAMDWDEARSYIAANVDSDGTITISPRLRAAISRVSAFSSGMTGATLMTFEDPTFASLILSDPNSDSMDVLTAIHNAVEKGVVPNSLMIKDISLDTENGKVSLALDCDVDYTNHDLATLANRIYAIDDDGSVTVSLKVLKKTSLAQANWEVVYDAPVTFGVGATEVSVSVGDNGKPLDHSAFYTVEIGEKIK